MAFWLHKSTHRSVELILIYMYVKVLHMGVEHTGFKMLHIRRGALVDTGSIRKNNVMLI